MRGFRFAWVLSAFLIVSAECEEAVYFADAKLKTAVEDALGIPDPTPADMLGLTSLYVGDELVSDVTGLEYAVNLQTLRLPCNWLPDMSFVAGMTELQVLVLNNNSISDLSPISGLTKLRYLDMHDNFISDIGPLAGLSSLETLSLRGNQVSDLSPLSGLTNLRSLQLQVNRISDISPLLSLTALTFLDLQENPLPLDAYTVYLPQIMANNPGIDVRPSINPRVLSISATAGGSVIDPGEGEFEYRLEWNVRLEAKAEPGFVFADWTGTFTTEQNPVYLSLDRNHQIRANFVSVSEALYVDDDAPGDPGPRVVNRSDPQENGTAEHPFDSIQQAIEIAAQGAHIFVHAGTYRENLELFGRDICLIGVDSNAPAGTGWPIIEGVEEGPVVCFDKGEGPACLLSGLIITGGKGASTGAVCCIGSSPTLAHCLIAGNRSTGSDSAAVYCSRSQAVLRNCTIVDNYMGPQGAAVVLQDSDATIANSILWGNSPTAVLVLGVSVPSLRYCDLPGSWPEAGDFDADPLFVRPGHWARASDPNVVADPEDPQAVWVAGDYHLQSQAGRWDPQAQIWIQDVTASPCIDAGDPVSPAGNEPDPNGRVVNMGAYGGTSEASKSPAGLPSPE